MSVFHCNYSPASALRVGLIQALGDMGFSREQIGEWASAYITATQDPRYLEEGYPLWWAVDRFMEEMTAEWAEECWKAILEVLARHPPDQVLGGLAAGPLEELINEQGPLFIQRIELLARRDPAFRNLLCGVWQSSTPEVWQRVEKARGDGSVP